MSYLVLLSAYLDPATSTYTYPARYWSTDGYISLPSDSPANNYWNARLAERPTWWRGGSVYWWGKRDQGSVGVIKLRNADGALDVMLGEPLRSRSISIYWIETGASFATAVLLHTLDADRIDFTDEKSMLLYGTGFSARLDKPLQVELFDATADTYENKPKPVVYGAPLNCPVPLVDAFALQYDCRDSTASYNAITRVRDNGVELNPATDWTANALGFVLNNQPAGIITADLEGEGAFGVKVQFSEIVLAIATRVGQASIIDIVSAQAIDAAVFAGEYAIYRDEATTALDQIALLCDSAACYWYEKADGTIAFARLRRPRTADTASLIDASILARSDLSVKVDRAEQLTTTLLIQKNWRVHAASEIATVLTSPTVDPIAIQLQQPFRLRVRPSKSITGRYYEAERAVGYDGADGQRKLESGTGTLLVNQAGAVVCADYLADLYPDEQPFALFFEFEVITNAPGASAFGPGTEGILTLDRFGCDAGRLVQIYASGSGSQPGLTKHWAWYTMRK